MEQRKDIEREHYEQAARRRGGVEVGDDLRTHGSLLVEPALRAPYEEFETQVRAHAGYRSRVLDIAGGTGVHSLAGFATGASPFVTDIATTPLQLAQSRAAANGYQLPACVADGERLPFRDGAFDVVSSAGALYCFDFGNLSREVRRVLATGGAWVIVDSFDQNPLYRLNRLVGFARGRRTWAAVTNIPDATTIRLLRAAFESVEVRYYGAFSFLAPLLRPLLGPTGIRRLLDAFDWLVGPPRFLAFKFVAVARNPRPDAP